MIPTNPMDVILKNVGLRTSLFPPTSRYYGIDLATMEMAEGRSVIYLRRRFVPQPERFELIQEHSIEESDRLDNIAARYLGDPLQFWRIADANRALRPDALTEEIGRKLRITQPEGIPGAVNA